MKKFTILVIALLLCVPSIVQSGRKRAPKSGKIIDNVFTDTKYNFQITVPEGWETKRFKKDDFSRLSIKKPKSKLKKMASGLQRQVDGPQVNFWILKSELVYTDFIDSLLSDEYSSKLKKAFIKGIHPRWETGIFYNFTTDRKRQFKQFGHKTVMWNGFIEYTHISTNMYGVDNIKRKYGGTIYIMENKNGLMLLISVVSHKEVIKEVIEELQPILNSLKWNK